jgi:hypothetical protein
MNLWVETMAAAAVAAVALPSAVALPLAPLPLPYHYLAAAVETTEGGLHRRTNGSVSDLSATDICPKKNCT